MAALRASLRPAGRQAQAGVGRQWPAERVPACGVSVTPRHGISRPGWRVTLGEVGVGTRVWGGPAPVRDGRRAASGVLREGQPVEDGWRAAGDSFGLAAGRAGTERSRKPKRESRTGRGPATGSVSPSVSLPLLLSTSCARTQLQGPG